MLSKNQIKFINSLKQKKYRKEQGLFIAEGAKIVPELIKSELKVQQVYAVPDFFKKNKIKKDIECIEISDKELERITSLTTANEVLAVCKIPDYNFDICICKDKLTLVLDNIQDPGNMGTIIRIADWFGIEQIICSSQSADIYNSKVVQATMGSIARIKVYYIDLQQMFKEQKKTLDLPIFGALLEGKNIYNEKLSSEGFIVIGNESKGISDEVISFISHKISIPSFSKNSGGVAESLNAAVAAGIVCSEFKRKS